MDIKKLLELREAQHQLQAAWCRHILAIAAGGFALLSGLGPPAPDGAAKYFLAAAWVFLGLGIVSGGAATYRAAYLAKSKANSLQEWLLSTIDNRSAHQDSAPIVVGLNLLLRASLPVMAVSLMLAVTCLVICSVLTTLGA